ncbi:AraC family ligand binding domain-containing protein, partial [Paratractidigestivibacter sp.]
MNEERGWNAEFFDALGLMHNAETAEIEQAFQVETRGHLSDRRVADWAGLLPSDDMFMVAHDMSSPTPLHSHDFYEFSYVTGGIVLNVVDGQRLYMLPGSLCVMNLNTRHTLEVIDSEAVVVNLGIRPKLFLEGIFREFMDEDNVMSEFLRGEGARGHLFFSDAGDRALIGEMAALASTYSQAGMRQSYALAGRVLMLLDRLARTPTYSYFGVDTKTMHMVSFIRDHCEVASVQAIA